MIRREPPKRSAIYDGEVFLAAPTDASQRLVAAARAGLAEALGCAPDEVRDVPQRISNEELFCLHRVRESRDVYFVVNPTQDEQAATMSIAADGRPELWDPSTGAASAIASRREGSRTAFEIALPPVGSVFVVAGDPDGAAAPVHPIPDEAAAVTLEGPWTFEAEDDNALVIKAWRATPERDGADASDHATGSTDDWLPVVAGAWAL